MKDWLAESWIWILLVSLILGVIIVVANAPEGTWDKIDVVLNTPLSDVKFWHFLLGTGFIIGFFAPRNTKGE